MTTVREITGWLDEAYPPALAADWDRVGLDVGDPDAPVRAVGFALDPTDATIAEASERGADLLVTHHPLLLRGINAVRADQPKGRQIMALLRAGVAHFCAHTNADHATNGVSDALAAALGLRDLRPLDALPDDPLATLVTYVPTTGLDPVLDALAAAGAGALGDYDRCSFTSAGQGRFRPLPGAHPHLGTVGEDARVDETRVEVVLPAGRTDAVVAALKAAHPYETPAYSMIDLSPADSARGTGRVGVLPEPMTAEEVARLLAAILPATAGGVRLGGDPERRVRTVALVGGAGDSFADQARGAGVDLFITSDLRHHPAQDFLAWDDAPVLIDIAHAAAESLWLPAADKLVRERAEASGIDLATYVSRINSDPWSLRV